MGDPGQHACSPVQEALFVIVRDNKLEDCIGGRWLCEIINRKHDEMAMDHGWTDIANAVIEETREKAQYCRWDCCQKEWITMNETRQHTFIVHLLRSSRNLLAPVIPQEEPKDSSAPTAIHETIQQQEQHHQQEQQQQHYHHHQPQEQKQHHYHHHQPQEQEQQRQSNENFDAQTLELYHQYHSETVVHTGGAESYQQQLQQQPQQLQQQQNNGYPQQPTVATVAFGSPCQAQQQTNPGNWTETFGPHFQQQQNTGMYLTGGANGQKDGSFLPQAQTNAGVAASGNQVVTHFDIFPGYARGDGNKRLQARIAEKWNKFNAASSRTERKRIVKEEVVDSLHSEGGQFLGWPGKNDEERTKFILSNIQNRMRDYGDRMKKKRQREDNYDAHAFASSRNLRSKSSAANESIVEEEVDVSSYDESKRASRVEGEEDRTIAAVAQNPIVNACLTITRGDEDDDEEDPPLPSPSPPYYPLSSPSP